MLGKHSKEITCGAWSEDNRLALGSKDKNLTISTADGDELERTVLKKEPVEIQFMTKAFNAKQNNNNEQKNWRVWQSIYKYGRTAYSALRSG